MTIWLYSIDWRSLAIEVLAECPSHSAAEAAHERHIASLTAEQLVDTVQYKTIAITIASPEMIFAIEQYNRLSGRSLVA